MTPLESGAAAAADDDDDGCQRCSLSDLVWWSVDAVSGFMLGEFHDSPPANASETLPRYLRSKR